jgi:hypothetical protein
VTRLNEKTGSAWCSRYFTSSGAFSEIDTYIQNFEITAALVFTAARLDLKSSGLQDLCATKIAGRPLLRSGTQKDQHT